MRPERNIGQHTAIAEPLDDVAGCWPQQRLSAVLMHRPGHWLCYRSCIGTVAGTGTGPVQEGGQALVRAGLRHTQHHQEEQPLHKAAEQHHRAAPLQGVIR